MKKVSFIAALVAASLVFCACNYSNKDLLKARIENMEKYSGNPGNAENIEEGIKQYDGEAQELIKKYDKIGIWYKILGTRYMDKKMWDKALDAFTNASKIYPENPIIYYYAAVCAGYMANNPLVKASEKMEYLKLSEQCYIASNKIDMGLEFCIPISLMNRKKPFRILKSFCQSKNAIMTECSD